jgi:3-oxoacyl-[acyl-carrier-protein] synthase III
MIADVVVFHPTPSRLTFGKQLGKMARSARSPRIGISAIGIYEPPWVLDNAWFESILPRKFVHHTGIESRRISLENEVTMGIRAVQGLRSQIDFDLDKCAGVVLASSSLVPGFIARKYPEEERIQRQRADRAARLFVKRLGIPLARVIGINWGCSGYAKALSIARRFILPEVHLEEDQFLLVATVNRSSKSLDYACKQTAGLFGDLAEVTLLARSDSRKYPVHFDLVFAGAETQPVEGVYFNFHLRENVLVPTPEGGRAADPLRLVFSLDALGIADTAPRAMAMIAARALRAAGIAPADVQFVVPHQAGTGIVRLAAMKLEEIGICGEVINGMTREVGNVVSSSVPYALKKTWDRLHGVIVCPTAGVGNPGDARVSQGCVVLRATEFHRTAGLGRPSGRAEDGEVGNAPAGQVTTGKEMSGDCPNFRSTKMGLSPSQRRQ